MRIALIGPAYPYRGGIAHATDNLARALSREHRVRVITFSRQYPTALFPGTSETNSAPEREALAGERMIDSLDPRTWLATARELAAWRPDVVAFMWWHPFFGLAMGSIARRLKAICGARVGFVCHNVRPHEWTPGSTWVARYALASGDFHLVMSATVAGELTALLPRAQPIKTTLPACEFLAGRASSLSREEARRRLGLPPDAQVALMFGLVRRYKGLEVMLQALARAPEVRLLVAGEFYEPPGRFESLAEELGVVERVTFLNRYVPDEEVPLHMAAADTLVAPYTSASQSGVLPQAMAAGLPIIASDFDGLTQNFQPGVTGLAVPPGDAGALAAALRTFFHPDRAEQFRAAARASNPAGTWHAFAADLLRAAAPRPGPERADGPLGSVLRWRTALEALVLLASGGFIARTLWTSAAALDTGALRLRGWLLLLALGVELLGQVVLAVGWTLGLRRAGVQVGIGQAACIRGTTQMARYIPGNIWHVLSRLSLSERAGLPLGRVGVSMVLEEGMILLAGIAASLITLPFWSGLHPTAGYLLLFALLPPGLAALHPQVLQVVVNLSCKVFKFPSAALSLRYRDVLLLFAYYTAGRFVVASAVYFIVAALYPLPPAALPAIIGITTLAWAVGYLSLVTPSGLGVREAAMLVLLSTMLPARVAGVAVLLARLFSVAGELIFGGLTFALGQCRRSTFKRLALERLPDGGRAELP